MNRLQLEKVSYEYAEEKVVLRRRGDLADIDLSMEDNNVVAFVGGEGSGKDTLLRLASGMLMPLSGHALWNGKPINGPSRDRGVVFHESALYPWLTVSQNIEFGLKLQGEKRPVRKARVAEYLELLKLTRLATKPLYKVSDHHELVFISFARCLATEPGLILIGDEPLAELNDRFRTRLQNAVLKVWKQKRPMILMATSDVEEAILMAGRIYVLGGRPGRIIRAYENPLTNRVLEEGVEGVRQLKAFRELRREITSAFI